MNPLIELLEQWERLSADLKPQTQEALFALLELQEATGKAILESQKGATET